MPEVGQPSDSLSHVCAFTDVIDNVLKSMSSSAKSRPISSVAESGAGGVAVAAGVGEGVSVGAGVAVGSGVLVGCGTGVIVGLAVGVGEMTVVAVTVGIAVDVVSS